MVPLGRSLIVGGASEDDATTLVNVVEGTSTVEKLVVAFENGPVHRPAVAKRMVRAMPERRYIVWKIWSWRDRSLSGRLGLCWVVVVF